jgi:hypothetical protein
MDLVRAAVPPPVPTTCPVCDTALRLERRLARLTIHFCSNCSHRVADHRPEPGPRADYHLQYDQAAFVDSLRRTRRRQAALIHEALGRLDPGLSRVLDYGAGRGWLLDVLRERGVPELAGTDPSPYALEGLRARGFAADPANLPFPARVVCALDVIEHFPLAGFLAAFRAFVEGFPEARLFVVKVPVSEGVLFRVAGGLARIGAAPFLEQMYQAGTHPPHFHYFSRRSLDLLLSKAGLRPRLSIDDPDFDDLLLRSNWARARLGALAGPVDRVVAPCVGFFGNDTRIAFAERA